MAFNQQGGGGDVDIRLPDFGELRKRFTGGGRLVGVVIAVILVIALAISAVYQVETEEIGVVLRLGEFVRQVDRGLHLKLPLIERVYKVPVERQLKAEFGFRTASAGVRTEYASGDFGDEANMLTGDLNAADVEWVVQYRIDDAEKYLFRVRNVESTFRDLSEAVMRQVVGDRTVNEVITVGRRELADLVKSDLQELCDEYETGIGVEQVVLQSVFPPDLVRPSFNEVNQAEQEKERTINEAQSQYNKQVPRALGEAQRTIQEAEGYATDRVNRAEGDAARFTSLYEEYRKAPDVTRTRMYLETMGQVLPRVRSKVILDEDIEGLLPLLNLGSEVARPPGGQP